MSIWGIHGYIGCFKSDFEEAGIFSLMNPKREKSYFFERKISRSFSRDIFTSQIFWPC